MLRAKQGGITLESHEVRVDTEAGNSAEPSGIQEEDHCEMHEVVADLMIFANETVARWIFVANPSNALVRQHLPPTASKLDSLLELARSLSLHPDDGSEQGVRQLLSDIKQALLSHPGDSVKS